MKISPLYKLIILIIILTVFKLSLHAQQSIQFTQYIFNSIAVNPAFAGNKEEWYVQATQRLQWAGIQGAPLSSQISIDGLTDNQTKNVGLGVQFTADKLGPQSTNSFYANYAYRIRHNQADTRRLCFGLAAGVTQYSIDGTLLQPLDNADPLLTNTKLTQFLPNFRVGVYYTAPKWYFGLSAMDLLSGSEYRKFWIKDTVVNIVKRGHFYLQTGGIFSINEYVRFRPGILWKEDFHGPSVVDINSMFIFNNIFWVGASYRTGVNLWAKEYRNNQTLSTTNAISGIIQFVIDDRYRIGYSYDFSTNALSPYQRGTHELTLGYLFKTKSKRILSPRFF